MSIHQWLNLPGFLKRSRRKSRRRGTNLTTESLEARALLAITDMGAIRGTVFNDLTGDGSTLDDLPLNTVTIELFRDGGNLAFDNGGGDDVSLGTVTTGAAGDYAFTGLTQGRYFVQQQAIPGYIQRPLENVVTVDISALEAQGTQGLLIDDFADPAGGQSLAVSFPGTPTASSSAAATGAVGSERDLFLEATAGSITLNANTGAFPGQLNYDANFGATGRATVVWDGVDGASGVNATGLAGVDLTAADETGLMLSIGTTDSITVTLILHSNATDSSIATVPVTAGPEDTIFVPFTSFAVNGGAGADFATIGAIEFRIEAPTAATETVGSVLQSHAPTFKPANFANFVPMTLGNLIFRDLNNSGTFDSGPETGIDGVALTLFEDTNNNQTLDIGTDTQLTTTVTAGGGLYQFTNLIPGNYLVQVDSTNFTGGGALVGLQSSNGNGTAPDPDDDVNDDDNGDLVGAVVVSRAMTLTNGGEPTTDGDLDNDTNLTLDFGFFGVADVEVTKTASAATVTAGSGIGNLTFTVTIRNVGTLDATGVLVDDTGVLAANLPAGVSIVSVTPSGTTTFNSATGTWTVGNLNIGASETLTVVLTVGASTAHGITLSNTAFLSDISETDVDQTNDSQTVAVNVVRSVDIAVTKARNTDPVIPGSGTGNLVYTVTATNNGPSDAGSVTLNDTDVLAANLPTGVTLVSAVGSGSTTFNTATGLWTIGNLATGASATLTLTLTVAANAADNLTLSNTATLAGVAETDSNNANNSQTVTATTDRNVDIIVTKADNADPVIAGSGAGNLVYTVTATNAGPSDASGVVISDSGVLSANLPAGVTFVSAVGTGTTTFSTTTGLWTIGNLTAGATETLTVTLTVGSSAAENLVISNTASLNSVSETDTVSANNTQSITTDVDRSVDIVVTKTDNADPVIAGSGSGNLVYTITAVNAGPSDASGVILSDNGVLPGNLPAGVTLISAVGSNSTTFSSTTGLWTIGSLAAGETRTLTVTLTVGASAADNLTLTNTASLNSVTETDSNPANNSQTVTTDIDRRVDIVITKTNSIDPVIAGSGTGNLVYTVTARNDGPSNASGVVVSDSDILTTNLPAGVTLVSVVGSGSTTFSTTTGLWTIGNLAAGESRVLTVTLTASAAAAANLTLSNTATLNTVNEPDSNANNNSQTVRTEVDRLVDIAVTKTASVEPVIAGSGPGNLVYTVTARNLGPSDASGVTVTDILILAANLPAGVTFVSATGSNSTTFNSTTGLWTIGSLPAGASRTLSVVLTVSASAAESLVIDNSAVLSAVNEPDSNPANDSQSVTTNVDRQVDISVRKSQNVATVTAGSGAGNLIYTITTTNNGPSDATGVTVADLDILPAGLPTGVTLVSAVGSGSTTFNQTTGVWTIGSLPSGASRTLTITLTVGATAAVGPFDNTASLSAVSEPDTNAANNNQSVITQIVRRVDIAVTKTQSANTIIAGSGTGNLVYTVTARNNGPSSASGVVIRDLAMMTANLPQGVTIQSAQPAAGTFNAATGLWTVGNLAVGESQTLTLTLTIGAGTADSVVLTNTASVYAVNEPDINRTNNSQTVTANVDRRVDIAVTKSQSTTLVTAGSGAGNLIYTLTASNSGPSDASGVTILDSGVLTANLPAGVTFVSATGSDGSVFSSITGIWTIGTLPVGASRTLTVTLTVGSTVTDGQVINNTASLNAVNEPDSNAANNTQSVTANVQRRVDVAITKADSSDPSFSPGNLTYTIVVRNNGPSQATGVVISDTLASGTTFVSGSSSLGAVTHSGGVVRVTVGTLNVGQTATVTILTRLDLPAGGNLLNIASVVSTETDLNLANNSAAEPTTIEPLRTSLSGFVYQDLNNNLLRDAAERGIANTTIVLIGTDIRGNAVTQRTATTTSGAWSFANLLPGSYSVFEIQPNFYVDGNEALGTGAAGTIAQDAFLNLTLTGGVNAVNFNFGEGVEDISKRPFLASAQVLGQQRIVVAPVNGTGSISGTVAVDANRNGRLETSDPRIPGAIVSLAGRDNAGNSVILHQATNAAGQYTFSNLPAGQYSVLETQPTRYRDGAEQAGTVIPDEVLDDLFSLIPLASGTAATGYNFLEMPETGANTGSVPVILAPAANGSSGTPTVSWTSVADTASWEVRIDQLTGNAGTVVSRTGLTATSWTVTNELALGLHRVWVRAISTNGNVGAWSAPVTFAAGTTATTLLPPSTTIDSTPVIDWSNISGATSYDMSVISLTTGQTVLTQTGLTNSHFFTTARFAEGRYRYSVRGINADVTGNWSAGAEFTISGAPTIRTTLRLNTATPTLQWDPVNGAVSYDLWVDNLNGSAPARISSVTTAATNALSMPVTLTLGNYRYYVRAVDAAGNRTAWSPPSSFTVATAPIVIAPPANTSDTTPTFSWGAVPGAVRYDVWVSNRQSGQFVRDQNVTSTTHTFGTVFPAGDYRVWVQAIGTTTSGEWSQRLDFTVHNLPAPTVTGPIATTTALRPTIAWTASTNAARYELWVDKVGGPSKVIYQTALTTTSFTPAANLALGTYRVWVRAFNTLNVASDWSAVWQFSIV